jgi:predicted PurR-regulated permease PerM
MVTEPPPDGHGLVALGRRAWATIGILLIVTSLGALLLQLRVLVVPLLIALFPATLLAPLVARLRSGGWRPAPAAALVLVGALLLVGGFVGGLVTVISAGAEPLLRSLAQGIGDLEQFLTRLPLGLVGGGGLQGLLGQLQERLAANAERVTIGALSAAVVVVELIASLALFIVALFFYLKDGTRLATGLRDTLPRAWRTHAEQIGVRAWTTIGAYFRGQLLVALFDAVFIGIGLALLRVPLALPLAMLVFLGALFPIIGAFVAGGVAVLVALADGGLLAALAVLALIAAVQQVEGHVFQPAILSRAIDLHPLVVIAAIAAGALLLGVLGAFIAVPVTASTARIVDYLRSR